MLRGAVGPLLDRGMQRNEELTSLLREVDARAAAEAEGAEPDQARVSSSSRKTNDS